MDENLYRIQYGPHTIRYAFCHQNTNVYFGHWAVRSSGQADLRTDPESIRQYQKRIPGYSTEGYAEFRLMMRLTAAKLLEYDSCIFHAVAFELGGKAWLLSAPPGTGKTTQYMNWTRAFPGEINLINGDMPALERREDGSVWVHPSPWNGKERMYGDISAPLGGIIYLRQGSENVISSPPVWEQLDPVLRQFAVLPETKEQILALMRLTDAVFTGVPVWAFTNLGDPASTALLRETILRTMEGKPE